MRLFSIGRPGGPDKYLFPGERILQLTRRHPAALSRVISRWLLGLALATLVSLLLAGRTPPPVPRIASTAIAVAATAQAAARWGRWWLTRYVITDERILLLQGGLVTKVSAIPFFKLADTGFSRPLLGRLLRYGDVSLYGPEGTLLHRLTYLPKPVELYRLIAYLADDAINPRAARSRQAGGSTDPQEADTGPLPPVVV
ncbi:MAG: PH domain-containing protein [Actinomycetota bacterium]|nr:PH domain-containing protein [Actinomycetota bacterium]